MKNLARGVIFTVLVILTFAYFANVFVIDDHEKSQELFNGFYSEEENTIDAIYFGSSSVNRYWIAPKAYNDQGLAVYAFANAMQPLMLVKNLIKESLKTQDPKLIIIELRTVRNNVEYLGETHIRRVTDNMKFSANKINAIDTALTYAAQGENNVSQNKMEYYFPIMKYHGRWDGNLSKDDLLLKKKRNKFKGFYDMTEYLYDIDKLEEREITDETGEIDPTTKEALADLLDYCDTLSCQVLFVTSPYNISVFNQKKVNVGIKMVEDAGYKVLNFNTEEMRDELELDFDTDYYDINHVNLLGAEKYTEYFSKYLKENYDLPDRRKDDKYSSWAKSYREYVKFVKEGRAKMIKKAEES